MSNPLIARRSSARLPTRRRRGILAAAMPVEMLEARRLLSTISWVNKGTGAGAGDTDAYNATYGANAATARAITQRAIDDWEQVIQNFNYTGGANTYSLTINAATFTGGLRGQTANPARNNSTQKKPISTTITFDNDGGGGGWYFDPVIGSTAIPDDGEFTSLQTAYDATSPSISTYDFYRTCAHEMAHAFGILYSSSAFLKIGDFQTNTGIVDPLDSGETLVSVNYNGGAIDYTLSTSGGGHLYEGPIPGGYTGPSHPNDLINAGRSINTGERELISETDALILQNVYGYTVKLPSTSNTFYANLNTTTNVLTVNGNPGTAADTINLAVSGANTVAAVNGTTEAIPSAQFTTLVANGNAGGDSITVASLPGTLTSVTLNGGTENDSFTLESLPSLTNAVVINGNDGDDSINASANGDFDSQILAPVTFNGGLGTDLLLINDTSDGSGADASVFTASTFKKTISDVLTFTSAENVDYFASPFNDDIAIEGLASTVTLVITGQDGDDTFTVGSTNGDIDSNILGNLTIRGGNFILFGSPIDNSAADVVIFNDVNDTLSDSYTLGDGTFTKSSLTNAVNFGQIERVGLNVSTSGTYTHVVNLSDPDLGLASSVTVNGGAGAETYNVSAVSAGDGLTVDAGDGNDLVDLSGAANDYDSNILDNIAVLGGAGTDSLSIDDSLDFGLDAYTLTASSFAKAAGGTTTYSAFENLDLLANDQNDTITVTSAFNGTHVNGGAGADLIDVIGNQAGTFVTVISGAGLDTLRVNADDAGVAGVDLVVAEDLALLDLHAGGTVRVTAGGSNTIVSNDTSISGTLDLADNTYVDKGPKPASYFDALLRTGYAGGAWNGGQPSIRSSVAATAVKANDALGFRLYSAAGSIGGATVAAGDIAIAYTQYGDTDLDRDVDFNDLLTLSQNYGTSGKFWYQGSFDYDAAGSVAFPDLLTLSQNYGLPFFQADAASIGFDAARAVKTQRSGRSLFAGDDEDALAAIA